MRLLVYSEDCGLQPSAERSSSLDSNIIHNQVVSLVYNNLKFVCE